MMTTKEQLQSAKLYAILDLGYTAAEDAEPVTESLLRGGADVLQLRAKGMEEDEILRLARLIAPLCRGHGVPLIVNDFPELAVQAGADGVHVGQDDGSLQEVRAVTGNGLLVGRSTHSVTQAIAARDEGFDYIGFGPLYATPTKAGRPGIGLEGIAEAEMKVGPTIPMFCIGGIKTTNLGEVMAAGARRAVIVSGLLQAPDIAAETRRAREILTGA